MKDLTESLNTLSARLDAVVSRIDQANVMSSLASLEDAVSKAAESFSGSWIGYHSRVYYEGLSAPPAGAHFSPEWGLMRVSVQGTRGKWVEYTYNNIYEHLRQQTTGVGLDDLITLANSVGDDISSGQEELVSILSAICEENDEEYLRSLRERTEKTKLFSVEDYVRRYQPHGSFFSRDTVALTNGMQTPPHIYLLAQLDAIKGRKETAFLLSKLSKQTVTYLSRRQSARREARTTGTNVFIGHGRSHAWRDLKDFINDRLALSWDEFNRVPVAGVTNIARLSQMLDQSAIAFLVMTAEDEQANGKLHARQNVIHEAGLFQGRLGFSKAILMLEDGCEEFSNIQGLGQIRFPAGRISAVFEDVRLVLEREGILPEA
jgi:hypothetical protein